MRDGHTTDSSGEKVFHFNTSAAQPFRLDFTAWALKRRPGNIIDRFDGHAYRRALATEEGPIEIAVFQPDRERSLIEVMVAGAGPSPRTRSLAMGFLERTLGIRRPLSGFYALASKNGEMGRVIDRFRGLKPVRFPSVFEALVNGIACQQISLAAGLAVLNRLAKRTGMSLSSGVDSGKEAVHCFPRPLDVARLNGEDLREIGFSRQKAESLLGLSRAVSEGKTDLEGLEGLDNGAALEALRRIRGVGRWTGEYALLRGLGRLDVFPGDDSGAGKVLAGLIHLKGPLSYEETKEAVSAWQPYAGFIYLHLLLAGLLDRGYMNDE